MFFNCKAKSFPVEFLSFKGKLTVICIQYNDFLVLKADVACGASFCKSAMGYPNILPMQWLH